MSPAAARYRAHVAAVWAAGPSDGAHDLGHLARVWANARKIALDEPEVDGQVLEAAVWFHDLVNLPKNSPDRARASTLSADAAVAFLRSDGFPAEKLPAVAHAICDAADPVASFAADTTLWGEMAGHPRLVDALRKAYARVLAFVAERTGA